jgi:two-component system sensor histidine kinase KdpD
MLVGGLPAWARYAGAVAIVAVTAAIALLLLQRTGDTRLSMVFLGGVLVTGVLLGSGPAYLAAATSFLAYNFFLVEPRFTLTMQTPEDLLTLLMFLASAGLTSSLAGRIRDQERLARARADATAALYAATSEFSASSEEDFIRRSLARRLAAVAQGEALVREGFRMHTDPPELAIGRELTLELDAAQRSARTFVAASLLGPEGWTLRPLRVGETTLGVAAWRRGDGRHTPEVQTMLEILADAGATAILRTRLTAQKGEAEARARTEDLRNALLSSISHDMRTPLAAIMASAGSLRRYGGSLDEAARLDLASNIEQEAARLDEGVANLLSMAQLESGHLSVRRVRFDPAGPVERVLASRPGAAIRVRASHAGREVAGDPLLFEQVFANVVDNALRYAAGSALIDVAIERERDRVSVTVTDEGPGVAAADLPRLFEKFFRAEGAKGERGTGLGLAIARGLMQAMGGEITAANRTDGACGLIMRLELRTR